MPELNDVNTGETIASQWGNDVRDRTIQRYADAATRDTEHPSPTEGDLAFLQDSNTVVVWDGGAWVNVATPVDTAALADDAVTNAKIGPGAVDTTELADNAVTGAKAAAAFFQSFEVDNSTEVTSQALTGSFADVASVTLSIPAGWGSWKCEAWASYRASGSVDATYAVLIRIDGTDQQTKGSMGLSGDSSDSTTLPADGAVGGRRTGMTTTGNRSVSLRAQETGGTVNLIDVYLYARAVRTS